MKKPLLICSLAMVAVSAGAAQNEPASTPPPAKSPAGVSSHVTITVDTGGKKETREIDLGNATTIKVEGSTTDKDSAGANGSAGATAAAPWLGARLDEISEDLRAQLPIDDGTGLIVRSVTPDGPAAQAGLRKDDVIVKFDDQLLTNARQLAALVRLKKDGEKARLTYFRRGKSATADAQIRIREGGEPGSAQGNLSSFLSSLMGKSGSDDSTSSPKSQSRIVVVDKQGRVLDSKAAADLGDVTTQIEKFLRAVGVDEKTITDSESALKEAAKAADSAASFVQNADADTARQIKDGADQVTKSVEKARAAAELARKQAEEARDRSQSRGDPRNTPSQ